MRTYTTKATEPQHYVQYDQGFFLISLMIEIRSASERTQLFRVRQSTIVSLFYFVYLLICLFEIQCSYIANYELEHGYG